MTPHKLIRKHDQLPQIKGTGYDGSASILILLCNHTQKFQKHSQNFLPISKMKVFSIAVALAAILFVAYALPKPQDEGYEESTSDASGDPEDPEEGGYAEEGEEGGEEGGYGEEDVDTDVDVENGEENGTDGDVSTTPDPCKDFEKECASNENAMAPGHNGGDAASNGTAGHSTPNPRCEHLERQCSTQNNSTMPGGVTKPTPPDAGAVTHPTANTQQPTNPTSPSMPTTSVTMTTPAIPSAGGRRRR